MLKPYLFIDRDGTLIEEPSDQQVDNLDKLQLKQNSIPALLALKQAGFIFVMVTNQDGLGTDSFPWEDFEIPQKMLLSILASQGITFETILICPHFEADNCACRKPKLGLLQNYLDKINVNQSYVIGDRLSDVTLAKNLGINSIFFDNTSDWLTTSKLIIRNSRTASVSRVTQETNVLVKLALVPTQVNIIETGIGFFDHMLEQLVSHGGMSVFIKTEGDLCVDEHHTVEDTAIALGEAVKIALGNKIGIARYGFVLPMDESLTEIALDLSGRAFFAFDGRFLREKVGDLPTELVSHFFQSFSHSLGATLHIKVRGENAHHMIEGIFKAVGRAIRQAVVQESNVIPSTKGIL